jgi:hypothetical protein
MMRSLRSIVAKAPETEDIAGGCEDEKDKEAAEEKPENAGARGHVEGRASDVAELIGSINF